MRRGLPADSVWPRSVPFGRDALLGLGGFFLAVLSPPDAPMLRQEKNNRALNFGAGRRCTLLHVFGDVWRMCVCVSFPRVC